MVTPHLLYIPHDEEHHVYWKRWAGLAVPHKVFPLGYVIPPEKFTADLVSWKLLFLSLLQ